MPRNPLHGAATKGDIDKVMEAIVFGAEINAVDANGCTPLHWAAIRGHPDVCTALVDAGANLAARDRWGRTPLAIAESAAPPNPALLKALTKATRRKLADLRAAERSEGRFRSDMVEVRARGRYARMARDEATRRAWVEKQVAEQRLKDQEAHYWKLKAQEAMALQEAEAAVRELEVEREVQHDLLKFRLHAAHADGTAAARMAMAQHVRPRGHGGAHAHAAVAVARGPPPRARRAAAGKRVMWDAIDKWGERKPPPPRGDRYGQPKPVSRHLPPLSVQPSSGDYHGEFEYDDLGL
mmetsp:Transcript_14181/g.36600  ORF Transcript_14181/g.36600 Transcript_14181/m.36600 type:complete len:296 (+) Transcript_14181:93-980(+)